MIKTVLRKISEGLLRTEEGNRLAVNYIEMQNHLGWKTHQGVLIQIANEITQYMLSETFTKLDIHEKDAQQRSFFITKEIIDFLLNPMKGAEKYAAIMQHNQRMEATQKKRPQGAKNGKTDN